EEQMNLSLCYHATEIEFENARSKENVLDESDRFIDNLFDFPQIHLSSFPEDTSTVLEAWEILHLANPKTSHFIYLLNDSIFLCTCMMFRSHGYICRHFYRLMTLTPIARFHIGLINRRWYKDQLQGINISNNEFIVISLNASTSKNYSLPTRFLQPPSFDANQIGEIGTINDSNEISSIISKKRKFGELFGLGKKISSDVVEEGNEDTYHEVLEFFRSIQQKMSQHRILGSSEGNFNTQNDDKNLEIRNPILRRPKGRPKSKRINSILEEPNTKTYR
ncbi:14928_t:CDS:2, partial [Funneliformis mosseae]